MQLSKLSPPAFVLPVPGKNLGKLNGYLDEQQKWFHSFAFSNGRATPGYDPSSHKLYHLGLPLRLDGHSVIDIGAYDGFFSFHAAHRGAARVLATDDFVWGKLPGVPAYENFCALRDSLELSVEDRHASVETLADTVKEQFDISLFLGVLYHAPDMVWYLRNAFAVTKHVCIVETLVDNLQIDEPNAALYTHGGLNSDASNWWGPNIRAVITMCERVGFSKVEFVNLWHINTVNAIRGQPTDGAIRSGRATFHAYR